MPKQAIIEDEELDELPNEEFGQGIEDDDPEEAQAKGPEEVEEIEEVEEVESEEEIEQVSARSLAEKFGFKFDSDDDAEGLEKHFGQVAQFVQQYRQEKEQYDNQLRQYQYQLAQMRQEAQQKPAEPPPAKPLSGLLSHWEKVPKWNDNWSEDIGRDAEGKLISLSGNPTSVAEYKEHLRWREKAERAIFENPQQFVYETFQANPDFQTAIQKQIEEAVFKVQDAVEAQRIGDMMRPYLKNEDGSFNDAGKAYMNAVKYAQDNLNVWDAARLHQIALQAAAPYLQQQQTPEKKAETPAQAKKKRQINLQKKAAEKKPNRGSTKKSQRLHTREDMDRHSLSKFEELGIDPHEVPAL